MSRIIKFRAWNFEENEMLEDVSLKNDTWDMLNEFLENTRDEVIYMQYTGLKDKNEKEIYENDIVSIEENVYEIIVDDVANIPFLVSTNIKLPLYKFGRNIEVIGNVFEDGQLLG